jgi:hypothetical protein
MTSFMRLNSIEIERMNKSHFKVGFFGSFDYFLLSRRSKMGLFLTNKNIRFMVLVLEGYPSRKEMLIVFI